MRKVLFVFALASVTLFSSCSTSGKTKLSNQDRAEVNYTSLADFLRHNSNVTVNGVEPNVRLLIRGISSVTSDTRPFIYLDKNPLGRDYNRANNAVNPNNIKRVEVISSLAQLTRYGQEGHSGVIKIHTKANPN